MSKVSDTIVGRRKKGVSDHNKRLILLYAFLVEVGLRDAYLVDCCALDVSELAAIISSNFSFNHLSVLEVQNDLFILNTTIFASKLVSQTAIDSKSNLTIIDINDSDLSTCSHESSSQINIYLIESLQLVEFTPLQCIGSGRVLFSGTFTETETFRTNVGYPTLAGWLLGYPAVYFSLRSSTSLSMTPLHKFSLLLTYRNAQTAAACTKGIEHQLQTIDLQVFTVPEIILQNQAYGKVYVPLPSNQRYLDYQPGKPEPAFTHVGKIINRKLATVSDMLISEDIISKCRAFGIEIINVSMHEVITSNPCVTL